MTEEPGAPDCPPSSTVPCVNSQEGAGVDTDCTRRTRFCAGPNGETIDIGAAGDHCARCINNMEDKTDTDLGCREDRPVCALSSGDDPQLDHEGNKCIPGPDEITDPGDDIPAEDTLVNVALRYTGDPVDDDDETPRDQLGPEDTEPDPDEQQGPYRRNLGDEPNIGESYIKIWIAPTSQHANAGSNAPKILLRFAHEFTYHLLGLPNNYPAKFPAGYSLKWILVCDRVWATITLRVHFI